MTNEEYALRVEGLRTRLYKTAILLMGSHSQAMDVLDEAVYKGLCSHRKLRDPSLFDTWMTRIVMNECYNELRRQKRLVPIEEAPEASAEEYDSLPLREAVQKLPRDLKDVITLRFFSELTVAQTAEVLHLPQGTVASQQRRALKLLRLELGEEEKQ